MKKFHIAMFITILLFTVVACGEETICNKLANEREIQVINDMNPISISLTDSLIVKCGCNEIHARY